MVSYVLAGLSLGAIYAVAASSLVITYVASGVFNLAFAATAYSVARFYYFLSSEHGWSLVPAALVSLLVFAPALGVVLYTLLFRHLRHRSTLIKLVATLGLSVALPPLVDLVLGKLAAPPQATGLAPRPLKVWHPFDAVLNADQLVTYIGLALVLVLGVGVLRFTTVGLKVRALVDSEALTELNGVEPRRVSLGVWAATTTLAGLAGVLVAPTGGLTTTGMTYLMSAAFAAVVAARLRSLPVAVGVSLAMGVVTSVIQQYIDTASTFAAAVLPSVPFAFMLVFLVYYAVRGQVGTGPTGSALDRAIKPDGGDPSLVSAATDTGGGRRFSPPVVATVVALAVVVFLIQGTDDYWSGLAAGGIAAGIALLSYTLVTGEGGMIWLCQITFAGGGAALSAEILTTWGWPPLLAVLVGAAAIVPFGVLLGALTIRLGDLYVALVTLTFGSLVQSLVLTQDPFYNYGAGLAMTRPGFATGNTAFAYLSLAIFLVLALLILNVRRSTAGLAMSAVRWSENGSRTLGISVVQTKLLVSGLATFIAALGGGVLAMNYQSTLPDQFNPFVGLIWLAVLLAIGARSTTAALVAGLLFALLPGVFTSYLPERLADLPTVLFGLGAIALAVNPEGAGVHMGHQLMRLLPVRERVPDPPSRPGTAAGSDPVPAGRP